jgi:alpha-L-fucosidase
LPWGRCTSKHDGENTLLYLHVFDWPADGLLVVPGLDNKVKKAYLLAGGEKLDHSRKEGDIVVNIPENAPDGINTVVVLLIKGEPKVTNASVAVQKKAE